MRVAALREWDYRVTAARAINKRLLQSISAVSEPDQQHYSSEGRKPLGLRLGPSARVQLQLLPRRR